MAVRRIYQAAWEANTPGEVDGWRRTGHRIPFNSSSFMHESGLMDAGKTVDNSTAGGASTSDGPWYEQLMLTAVEGGINAFSVNEPCYVGNLPTLRGVFEVRSTGAPGVRVFCGLSENAQVAAMAGVNDPAYAYVGLQFCDDRDSNWQIAHKDSTQTLVDTGIAFAFDTVMAFEVEFTGTGTTATVRIWETRDATNTFSTNITTELPGATTTVADSFAIVNDFAPLTGVTWRHYLHRIWTKPLFLEPRT